MRQPFTLKNAFFTELRFDREPIMPGEYELKIVVETKIIDKKLPEQLEVHLKLETDASEEQPFYLKAIVVGKFAPTTEDHTELSEDVALAYVRTHALYVLWAYADQMISQVTSQMGVRPVHFPPPAELSIDLQTDIG